MTTPRALTDADHGMAVASAAAVAVVFTAPWCLPSRRVVADLPALAKVLGAGVAVMTADVTRDATEAAGRAGIVQTPTLVLYRAGAEAARKIGHRPRGELADWISEQLRGYAA